MKEKKSSQEKQQRNIRVLVVDDTALMRRVIGDVIQEHPRMEVAGTAFDGEDALNKVRLYKPDVVTMDLEMPRLDGISALKRIMNEDPLPVIMVSTYTQHGSEKTMEALSQGAVDFVPKPASGLRKDATESFKELLPEKIVAASQAKVARLVKERVEYKQPPAYTKPPRERHKLAPGEREAELLIVIGSSTGGPKALEELLRKMPADLPAAVLIAQHMPAGFTASLARRLNQVTSLEIKEGWHGAPLLEGTGLVAPGDYHMKVQGREVVLDSGPKVNHVRPAVDVLLESLIEVRQDVISVILTGMGKDGASGARVLKARRGSQVVIVEDPRTAVVKGMPEAAIKAGSFDAVAPLPEISEHILRWIKSFREHGKPSFK